MLRSIKEQFGYEVHATDGDIGKVDDFLFDDIAWIIRYLVVDTGSWLSNRKVLVSFDALGQPDWSLRELPLNIDSDQVKNSPLLEENEPVSLRYQMELHEYYKWAPYWEDSSYKASAGTHPTVGPLEQNVEDQADLHLRSTNEVLGYHIQALDGEIGHVEDYIVEDENWIIRYVVVDTRNWLPGRKVLVSPLWVENVSWSAGKVYVDLSREVIKDGPEFDSRAVVNREYEIQLYDYYGRPRYWE